ncbi:BMP family lipoprotein [Longispora albida]|uniref:BMP family lipoprotein n=1 Tax=Longispora albida TaxID=203523 RepID=UPI000365AE2E|nr:BMP family ABC transporter substrate-binding protein [Longispora albida]
MRIVAVLAIGGLALSAAACGDKPSSNNGSSGNGKKYKACMVTDVGGIDDKSFNTSAWQGLQDAKAANGNIEIKYSASKAETDYQPNLNALVTEKCDLILAVGGLMTDATKAAAAANPAQKFAIIDSNIPAANVYSMQFNTAQAGFLAGYLAAGSSKSGKVATWGGLKIPPVTIFMDGFAEGVAHYNKVKSKTVAVLGWDNKSQEGLFAGSFTDQNKGKQLAEQLVAQGADVIMPVAGGAGLGTASAAQASGGKTSVIWVDADGCKSAAQYCDVFMTTVVKNIAGAVKDAVVAGADGKALTGAFTGVLGNNGVSLAPYNKFDSKVPAELKTEIDALKKDIVDGKIKIESPAQPK